MTLSSTASGTDDIKFTTACFHYDREVIQTSTQIWSRFPVTVQLDCYYGNLHVSRALLFGPPIRGRSVAALRLFDRPSVRSTRASDFLEAGKTHSVTEE